MRETAAKASHGHGGRKLQKTHIVPGLRTRLAGRTQGQNTRRATLSTEVKRRRAMLIEVSDLKGFAIAAMDGNIGNVADFHL